MRRCSPVSGRGPGRPPANAKPEDPAQVSEAIMESEVSKEEVVGCLITFKSVDKLTQPSQVIKAYENVCKCCHRLRKPLYAFDTTAVLILITQ